MKPRSRRDRQHGLLALLRIKQRLGEKRRKRMADPNLSDVLKEKYHLPDEMIAEGMFVRLTGSNKEAIGLVAVGITETSLVLARPILKGIPRDYELISVTPLSLLTVSIQNYSDKIVAVRSQYKPVQVLQMCSCDFQDEIWRNFVQVIESIFKKSQKMEGISEPVVIQHQPHRPEPVVIVKQPCSITSLALPHIASNKHLLQLSSASTFINRTRSLTSFPPDQKHPHEICSSQSTSAIPDHENNSSALRPDSFPKEFQTFNKKYVMKIFQTFGSGTYGNRTYGAERCLSRNNSHSVNTSTSDVSSHIETNFNLSSISMSSTGANGLQGPDESYMSLLYQRMVGCCKKEK